MKILELKEIIYNIYIAFSLCNICFFCSRLFLLLLNFYNKLFGYISVS